MTTAFEPRLQKRYEKLVAEHLSVKQTIAAGLRSLPARGAAFASTQAAWRFYQNERVSVEGLAQPLLACAHQSVAQDCAQYALVIHDVTDLLYKQHTRKAARVTLHKGHSLGYRLQSSLLVSDRTGAPLATVAQSLWTTDGIYTTRSAVPLADAAPLDELTEVVKDCRAWAWGKPVVHIYDRGGDSVAHYRQWSALKALWVVRADAKQRVVWHEQSWLLGEVAAQLDFRFSRKVEIKGKKARQYVAATEVTITRPARPHRQRNGVVSKRQTIAGEAITLRLIVSQVREATGQVVAEWLLYTNVAGQVTAPSIARWYYWRWKIECYFKLLKSAGQNIEGWQQERPQALLKRLVVASMACVVVWQLGEASGAAAAETRALLIRLSGRQMKWGVAYTHPALLAGLSVLMAMLDVLQHYEVDQLRQLAQATLPGFAPVKAL